MVFAGGGSRVQAWLAVRAGTVSDATTRDCPECTMSIPVAARRCPECTAEIAPASEQPQPVG